MSFRRNIDMDLLRSFVLIVEQQSFTRAAEQLDRTQSAISLQVKRLEEQLGTQFFIRAGRGVKPTEAGDVLLDYAQRILALNDELVGRMVEPAIAGPVRFGISEAAASLTVGRALRRFGQTYPDVQLTVRSAADAVLEADFADGRLDILFLANIHGAGPRQVRSSDVLWEEPLVWAAANGPGAEHVRTSGAGLRLALAVRPCILRDVAERTLDDARITWHTAFEGVSSDAAMAAAAAGLGVTLVPQGRVGPGLQRLSVADGLPILPVMQAALRQRKDSGAATDRLVRFLAEACAGTA